jgi:hypothetical protein
MPADMPLSIVVEKLTLMSISALIEPPPAVLVALSAMIKLEEPEIVMSVAIADAEVRATRAVDARKILRIL